MDSCNKESVSQFRHVEVPSRYESLTDYTYCVRNPDGTTQDGWPDKPTSIKEFLWLQRREGWEILALRIEDGDEVVEFYDVLNLPKPHTPK